MTPRLDPERLALLVHEVRSPVAALSAIAETLGEADLDSQARRSLIRLVTLACRGIERIVVDAAVASIRLESIDPVGLVGDVVAQQPRFLPFGGHRIGDVLFEFRNAAILQLRHSRKITGPTRRLEF